MTKENEFDHGTLRLKTGLAEMLKGGVIMDVTDDKTLDKAVRKQRQIEHAVERSYHHRPTP